MTVLVTGGSGQLASALATRAGVTVAGRPRFDFDHPATLLDTVRAASPKVVVNAAAYTAVDRAESEPEAAMRANRDGPVLLARYCADAGIPLIHVSTDYVFDGTKGAPYVETDPTNPAGVYGATKLAGEQAVLASCPRALVLRTAWVYGPRGKNFVLTMLNAAKKTDRVRVVADQIGTPSSADDLAAAILSLAERVSGEWRENWAGVYHVAGSGSTSWHGLAVAVFEEAAARGLPYAQVDAIATADWPTPARRPADSRLDCGKLERVFGLRLPHWRDAVARTVASLA